MNLRAKCVHCLILSGFDVSTINLNDWEQR